METRNSRGFIRLLSSAAMLLVVSTAPAMAQVTSRVSVDSGGQQGNGHSYDSPISADCRYVAFESHATSLVAGDTNGYSDVFVHDRQSGTTERVSIATGGAQGDRASWEPSISAEIPADGRYVAFASDATNLVTGDTNGYTDVFVRDRQSGTTERVSVATDGAQGDRASWQPSISADGRYVAFASDATNLVSGDSNFRDVFVHDRVNRTTERVSVDSSGAEGNGLSWSPSISADGRCVAFDSDSSNFVPGDTNGHHDVFVHDRQGGTTERVSVATGGAQADNDSDGELMISAYGRFVAFRSEASNLVAGDTNSIYDVFVHDRESATTERVSIATGGVQADDLSYMPSISADGRYVSFASYATNLVAGDTNDALDVFLHDRHSGMTEQVSVDSSGTQGNFGSTFQSISADGRYVAFGSSATNLVTGDTNLAWDVFVRDRGAQIGTKFCTANANSTGSPANIWATGSASSAAGDLTLVSSPVPNQFGIFFHGANQSQIPFGNGFLCTTGEITRGAVISAAGNIATYIYDNSDARHSVAAFVNTTRHFQYWFRDPMGGGALFNTSNAISIAILP